MKTHPYQWLNVMLLLALLLPIAGHPTAAALSEDIPTTSQVTAPVAMKTSEILRNSSVMFIENVGQFPEDARFQVRGGNGTLWLTDDALWITIVERSAVSNQRSARSGLSPALPFDRDPESEVENRQGVNLRLSFPNANPHPRLEPFDRLETTVSYFLGNDPDGWRPDVPVWGGVRYVDLYPGIDLEVTSEDGQFVQRLHAQPGADLSQVQLRVEGAEAIELAGVEGLRLSTAVGDYILPLLTVADTTLDAHPAVSAVKATTFDIAAPLILSPRHLAAPSSVFQNQDSSSHLLYGTFLGGSGGLEGGNAISVDGTGAVYVTGGTGSTDFPTTPGAFDTSYNGNADVFVVKLNAAGSGLAYSTFIGGSGSDTGSGIAVTEAGTAYVTGQTDSADFPTTPGAFDTTFNGGDAFVVKLNAAGSGLGYSTFLGGNGYSESFDIAIDGVGAAYITGRTNSADFPTTSGAFNTTNNGDDAFVVKLNAAGSGLAYSTFLGGSGWDDGYAIAVDGAGAAYVTGLTGSSDFPTTLGAFNTTYNGDDAFVVKLNAAGSDLVYSTFLGGSSGAAGYAIAVDEAMAAYVTGLTYSADFPTTPGAFDTTYNGEDAFVVKLNAAGSGLAYSTFIGGSGYDDGNAIAVDGTGAAYVTGGTSSSDFPATPGAFDTSYNGNDAFVVKLNADGSGLAYSTFLGGSGWDYGRAIAVDGAGAVCVTGQTGSTDFPTTPGTFDTSYNGNDAFVVKIDPNINNPSLYLITGYVRDHTGAPLPGAIVSSEPWGLAFTDENGYYEMDMLIGGVYIVRAQVGSQSLSPEARVVVLPPSAENQNFTTLPQYGQVSGVVQERGTLQPIHNVRVSLGGDVTRTNDEGQYLLTQVLPGMHTLRVYASGYESYEIVGFNVAENDMLTKDVLLQSIQSQNYYLPYPGGVSYECTQGNYGPYSHFAKWNWEYAFDFGMKTGDAVVASLEGRVVAFVEKFTEEQRCDNISCADYANYVRIRHADGYDTLYFHLNHNSVSRYVEEDQFVQRGQQIAEADNTGWATGSHLDITRHTWGYTDTQPLAFADVPGNGIPQKDIFYPSGNYPESTITARHLIVEDVLPQGNARLVLTGIPTYTLLLRAFGYLSDVTEMKLADSELNLETAEWLSYTTSVTWQLPVVYALFRDGHGNLSEVVSDTVDAVGYETLDARFAISPTVCVNAPIILSNQTTPFCEGCDWQWDFGNGVSSRGADPQFDFSGQSSFYGYWLPDVYTVTLSVSNAFTTTFFSRTVQALPQPSAGFTLIQDGHTITVTAEDLDAASWYWTFGDGASANGRVATHTYTGATSLEIYTVRLTVESHQGCTNSSYQSPSNPPVALEIDGPKAGLIGESFTFTATANVTATSPLTYVWRFGEGLIITHTGGISDTAVFSWTIPGPKTVVVTATNAGGTITATHSMTLYIPVQANFMANPTAGTVPLTVVFTNTSTGDYDSSLWDFGDGTSNTIQLPAYKYTKAGTYTVTLTVNGPGGSDTEIKTNYITVTEVPDDYHYVYLPLVLRSQASVKAATKPLQVTSKHHTLKHNSR